VAAGIATDVTDGPVGIVSLNRPEKLNAISHEPPTALVEHLRHPDGDPATSVVVLAQWGT
jgi:enoyl-CoA hydratase/carnithine racemase